MNTFKLFRLEGLHCGKRLIKEQFDKQKSNNENKNFFDIFWSVISQNIGFIRISIGPLMLQAQSENQAT